MYRAIVWGLEYIVIWYKLWYHVTPNPYCTRTIDISYPSPKALYKLITCAQGSKTLPQDPIINHQKSQRWWFCWRRWRSDSQGRAGPHLAITSTSVTEESLLEVHCTHCELHSTVKSRWNCTVESEDKAWTTISTTFFAVTFLNSCSKAVTKRKKKLNKDTKAPRHWTHPSSLLTYDNRY